MLVGNNFKQLEKQKTHFQLNEKFPNTIGYFQFQFLQQFNCILLLPIEFEYFQLKNFSIENFPSSLYFKSGSPNKKLEGQGWAFKVEIYKTGFESLERIYR